MGETSDVTDYTFFHLLRAGGLNIFHTEHIK